ncbi:MAG: hypothetical protein N3H31_03265 [Candidatus Nezhaarchaeota archaeon]|nr:hypothetical protein [Candidatus Nezhaarchaeota archaeon]
MGGQRHQLLRHLDWDEQLWGWSLLDTIEKGDLLDGLLADPNPKP